MEKALNFIKKSNHVLFFLVIVVFIGGFTFEMASKLFKKKYEPPKIELVDSTQSKDELKRPVYTVEYLTRLKDVYIFELTSDVIDTNEFYETEVVEMFNSASISHDLYVDGYLSHNAVNLMFVREDGTQTMLLKRDGLIVEFSKVTPEPVEGAYHLDKNLYLIIDEDTNQNGYLDQKDAAKLFSSNYDGQNLVLILNNVGSFNLIADNKLIISQKGDSPKFFTFDVNSGNLVSLNTTVSKTAFKSEKK